MTLAVGPGELHALMGPNGSGKSTLANTLLGNPAYEVTGGRILLGGEDITTLPIEERAAAGPVPRLPAPRGDPGRLGLQLLAPGDRRAARASTTTRCSRCACSSSRGRKRLGMDDRFQERYLNEGFSGGEKKRNEVLQMALLEPDVAVLDETDSGLDIDALRQVAAGIEEVRKDRPQLGILLITHYQRILDHLTPDVVHVLDRRPDRRDRRRRARPHGRGRGLRRRSEPARRKWRR